MEISSSVPTQTVRQIIRRPIRTKRRNKYKEVHSFKRTFNFGSGAISIDPINPSLFGFNFSMNDMPNFTELTSLYDNYKLTGVKVKCMPLFQTDSNSTGTINNVTNVPIFYAIDRTDDVAPPTVDALLEYNDHKIGSAFKGFQVWIPNPKFQDATAAVRGGWVSTSNPSLNWYGLKVAIPPTGTVGTRMYVLFTYYVSCKDPK